MTRLRNGGFDVGLHLPHDAVGPVPSWLPDVDLLVQRGLDRDALTALGTR